jgi:thiamine-monophosphate kinase
MPRDRKTTERDLIDAFTRMIRATRIPSPGVVIGVGDDAAVIRPSSKDDLIVTADALVENRHFERRWLSGFDVGWRLAAVNLSDVASMGGRPLYGVLSLALPADLELEYTRGIERGVRDHLAAHRATIVGGNISGIETTLVCDLTLIGACAKGKAWKRRCLPGRDAIVVAGYLGDSRAGLELLGRNARSGGALVRAYKSPVPRLDVAKLLESESAVHGAIDVSDGLSTDLIHLCEASDAGCEIDAGSLPVSRALRAYCLGARKDPIRFALHGGEDYALVLAVASGSAAAVAKAIERQFRIPARVLGRFTRSRGRYQITRGRRSTRFGPGGWDHLRRR